MSLPVVLIKRLCCENGQVDNAMTSPTYDQLKELVILATTHSAFDYLSIILSSVVTLLAVGMSYFFFKKHAVQVTNEKVIEKDVEKLYEAVDCIFRYSDSVGLYLSLKKKQYLQIVDGQSERLAKDFLDKVVKAQEAMYAQFSCIHKASFILRALGEKETSLLIDSYREGSVALRKQFYSLDAELGRNKDAAPIAAFLEQEFESKKEKLNEDLDKCLEEVVECKKRIKAIAS